MLFGMGPEKSLVAIQSSLRFASPDISSGIVPLKKLPPALSISDAKETVSQISGDSYLNTLYRFAHLVVEDC